MKNPKYIFDIAYNLLLYLIIDIFLLVGCVYLVVVKKDTDEISLIFIILIINIQIYLSRKHIFKKMIINEQGITIYYRKTILKQLKWENIVDALVFISINKFKKGIFIALSDTTIKMYDEKCNIKEISKNSKNTIEIDEKSNFFEYLCKYKNKIPVEIRNLFLLSEKSIDELKKYETIENIETNSKKKLRRIGFDKDNNPIFEEVTYEYFKNNLEKQWFFYYKNETVEILCDFNDKNKLIYELHINRNKDDIAIRYEYNSAEELLKNGKVNGKTLQEIWEELEI